MGYEDCLSVSHSSAHLLYPNVSLLSRVEEWLPSRQCNSLIDGKKRQICFRLEVLLASCALSLRKKTFNWTVFLARGGITFRTCRLCSCDVFLATLVEHLANTRRLLCIRSSMSMEVRILANNVFD